MMIWFKRGRLMRIVISALLAALTSGAPAVAGEVEPIVIRYKENGAGISNLGRGTLTMDEQGCVRFNGAVTFWPPDSFAEDRNGEIVIVSGLDGKEFHLGHEAGGGGVSAPVPPMREVLAQDIPTACADGPFWNGNVLSMNSEDLARLDEEWANRVPVPLPPEAVTIPSEVGRRAFPSEAR